ncbi:hypothetical protein RFI_32229, partial [Reticulomyxa filosa]
NPKKEMKNQNAITLDAKKKVNTKQSCYNKIGILVNCWLKRFGCNHTCLDQSILLKKTILSMQQEIQFKNNIETIKKEFNDQKKQNQEKLIKELKEKNIELTRNLESIDVLTSPVKQIEKENAISFNLIRPSESFKQSNTEHIYT